MTETVVDPGPVCERLLQMQQPFLGTQLEIGPTRAELYPYMEEEASFAGEERRHG
jgi:hypothetical protein